MFDKQKSLEPFPSNRPGSNLNLDKVQIKTNRDPTVGSTAEILPDLPVNHHLKKSEVTDHPQFAPNSVTDKPLGAAVERFGKMNSQQLLAKERVRQLQKVWTAMTKFIASQCANGKTVDLPLAGKFRKIRAPPAEGDSLPKYMFMPSLDFVGSGHFKFSENDFNVSPLSKGAAAFQAQLVTVSLTSLGAVSSIDRESIATALKAIFVQFVSTFPHPSRSQLQRFG